MHQCYQLSVRLYVTSPQYLRISVKSSLTKSHLASSAKPFKPQGSYCYTPQEQKKLIFSCACKTQLFVRTIHLEVLPIWIFCYTVDCHAVDGHHLGRWTCLFRKGAFCMCFWWQYSKQQTFIFRCEFAFCSHLEPSSMHLRAVLVYSK